MSSGEDKFLEIVTDVVIRYKGHRSYKDEHGALKALKKRASGYSPETCKSSFETACRIYDLAAAMIIERKHISKNNPESPYAEYEDVDFKAALAELRKTEPGIAEIVFTVILNWVILWHYLK